MTQPAAMLDAVAARMRTRLGSAVAEVRVIDATFADDLTDYLTVRSPGVLLTCVSIPVVEGGQQPMKVEPTWLAICVARLPRLSQGESSRGDVAMNLSAVVAMMVEREMWNGQANRCARRIHCVNEHSKELAQKGVSMWTVTWLQQIEITPADEDDALEELGRIRLTFEMGDGQTPDAEAEQELGAAQ